MVNIVVRRIVACDVLQRVPWERVPAVVVDGLGGAEDIEEERHARRHHAELVGETCAGRVHHESFDRVVVESAVGVWNVEAVVAGVPVRWREKRLG